METANQEAEYELVGFCSESCKDGFNNEIQNYPLLDIATDIGGFVRNIRKLYSP